MTVLTGRFAAPPITRVSPRRSGHQHLYITHLLGVAVAYMPARAGVEVRRSLRTADVYDLFGENNMKRLSIVSLGALFLCVALPASADSFPPSHSCRKPFKPYKFNSEWEIQQFKDEVERYKRCISDFVDEQNEEARNHQQAAEDAIEEWNRYVKFELN